MDASCSGFDAGNACFAVLDLSYNPMLALFGNPPMAGSYDAADEDGDTESGLLQNMLERISDGEI